MYCGKEAVVEEKALPQTVIRNVTKALRGQPTKRVIVTDNYYSSVALSIKMLSLGLYHVGTVRTNRLGWCAPITYTQSKRPKKMPRGTYRLAQCSSVPELVAVSWMDSKPVNFLATVGQICIVQNNAYADSPYSVGMRNRSYQRDTAGWRQSGACSVSRACC